MGSAASEVHPGDSSSYCTVIQQKNKRYFPGDDSRIAWAEALLQPPPTLPSDFRDSHPTLSHDDGVAAPGVDAGACCGEEECWHSESPVTLPGTGGGAPNIP